MATLYYVNDNEQTNGDHEVHTSACMYLPAVENRTYLGAFDSCEDAVEKAKDHHKQVNGCAYCSKACHTS